MGKSLIPQRVKNTGTDLVIAAAFIAGGIYLTGFLNRRFNILGKFVSGAGAIGTAVGKAVGLGVGNIPGGVVTGAAEAFGPGGPGEKSTRQALGLEPDTADCLHIPFTNIPLPGSKCAGSQSSAPADSTGQTKINPVPKNIFPQAAAQSVTVRGPISIVSRSGAVTSISQQQQAARQIQVFSSARTVQTVFRAGTQAGKPNVIQVKPGQQAAVFTTTTGGTRVAVGSPALIARLKQNLR